jgi:ubiquinone/menaquinone biosynthesis C-methylase UbiE
MPSLPIRCFVAKCLRKDNKRVLEIGDGPGNTACLIAEQHGWKVHAIDISEVMIDKAKESASQKGMMDK